MCMAMAWHGLKVRLSTEKGELPKLQKKGSKGREESLEARYM